MKKNLIIIACVFGVILAVLIGLRFLNSGNNQQQADDVVVFTPQPNELVKSPILIEGKARGTWYFEASFPIHLLNDKSNELAIGIAQAQSDWMTTDFVPFKAEIRYQSDKEINGTLVFQRDNPSGLPENDKEMRIPVRISPSQTIKVKVYFNNDKLDPEFSCNKVFFIEREIPKTEAVARAAIEELLKGPTEKEKSEGFFTSINEGVKIQKLSIINAIAKIDFNEQLEYQVGGSCRVAAIRAQITQTLKQFATVGNVIISINSRTEDILQP